MSEMLGNQYFLARSYARAAEELENALAKDRKNKAIRRKLIICYTQIGDVRRALSIFLSLVKEDIDYIINTDPIDDDCPCPELVADMEKHLRSSQGSADYYLIMGMLWLYCNVKKSLKYFQQSSQLEPDNGIIKSLITLISVKLE